MHLKEGYHLHNGKYLLLNIIGEGGFSLTYKGLWNTEIHGPLGKIPTQAPICVKEYFFKDYCLRNEKTNFVETNSTNGRIIFDKYKEKIIKEARILAEIHHPNVVKVLEVFKQNNTVYTIMEFISGDSLKNELEKSGIFSEEKLLPIIYKIGHALQYIHEKSILHLDIKPSNILMEGNNPKLIDFGISKRYDPQHQQETSTTILAASKGYASIEQYDSEGMQMFSPCPDVYSLGATMYYLLTGEVPTESILRSTKGLQNPRELNPNISEKTENVILKAMELHADDRYQSVLEMIIALGYNPEEDQTIPLVQTITSNNSSVNADEDQTVIINPINQPIDTPFDVDDQTEVYSVDEEEEKRIKKRKIKLFLSLVAASIICIIAFLFINDSAFFQKNEGYYKDNEENYIKYLELGKRQYQNANFSQALEAFNLAKKHKDTKEIKLHIAQTQRSIESALTLTEDDTTSKENIVKETVVAQHNEPQIADPNKEKQPDAVEPIKDPEQEKHDQFFKSGLNYYNKKDFQAAKKDFQAAISHKNSSEAKNYIKQCDKELEEIEIVKKRNNYDFRMKFGNFTVVMKKSNNLWGMVDGKCDEIVPCKYSTSILDATSGNRFFVKEDGSVDVYSKTGEIIPQQIEP